MRFKSKSVLAALVAVFMMSAVAAAAASAHEYEGEVGAVFNSTTEHIYTYSEKNFPQKCTTENFTVVSIGNDTNRGKLKGSTIRVAPAFSGCTTKLAGNTLAAEIKAEGCEYEFSEPSNNPEAGFDAERATVCPAGHAITDVTPKLLKEGKPCTITMGSSSPINSYRETNVGTEKLSLKSAISTGITYTSINCAGVKKEGKDGSEEGAVESTGHIL